MIARTWTGRTDTERAALYEQHLLKGVFPELDEIDGHEGAWILRGERGGLIHYTVITLWDSMESITKFAGDKPENAVVPPEAQALLQDYDDQVSHLQVVHSS